MTTSIAAHGQFDDTVDDVDLGVVVVGGGIGGLACALALRRAGVKVRLLEQAPEFGEVGAGLQMAPNASRLLRDWGLLDEVIARGVVPKRISMYDAVDGRSLTFLDLAEVERRYEAPYVVIHRSDLHSILLDACRRAGVDLRTGETVTDSVIAKDRATAITAKGSHTARVLIAADGLQSALRSGLSADEPVNSGYVAYRGAIPVASITDRDVALDEVVLYVGPGCHFIHYPLRGGGMLNQVAVFRSERAAQGGVDWGTPDELDAAFAGTCSEVRVGLASLWRDRWWQMFDRTPITQWVDRRLVLTGDAAHPMLQYLAQGACQAIEDAAALGAAVARYSSAPRASGGSPEPEVDWDAALRDYTKVRVARTATVQTAAREWGEFWHCDGITRSIRNALLRDRAPDDYRYIDWLYAS